jgi:hypothetical protein
MNRLVATTLPGKSPHPTTQLLHTAGIERREADPPLSPFGPQKRPTSDTTPARTKLQSPQAHATHSPRGFERPPPPLIAPLVTNTIISVSAVRLREGLGDSGSETAMRSEIGPNLGSASDRMIRKRTARPRKPSISHLPLLRGRTLPQQTLLSGAHLLRLVQVVGRLSRISLQASSR